MGRLPEGATITTETTVVAPGGRGLTFDPDIFGAARSPTPRYRFVLDQTHIYVIPNDLESVTCINLQKELPEPRR